MPAFDIVQKDPHSRARAGIIHTAHGELPTPAYAIVGTNGVVRCMTTPQLEDAKTSVLMVNTYHRWQELGDEGLERYQGLHIDMDWNHPIMTDSGGFQVFSLGAAREEGVGKLLKSVVSRPKRPRLNQIAEDGVYFTVDDRESYLDAETSMRIQRQLGADIIFAFDECSSPLANYEYSKAAMERTHRWAKRCVDVDHGTQLLYGIIQGGRFQDLRQFSAKAIRDLPFEGVAIGGSFGDSYGDTKRKTYQELNWVVPLLDEERPRHLLGIGRIEDLLQCVEQGIDTFDCVVPTREARHGWIWTRRGRLDVTKGVYQQDARRIEQDCHGWCCTGEQALSRSQIRELFKTKQPRAAEIATFHNVRFFNQLMSDIRISIIDGQFSSFKRQALMLLSAGDQ
ncbi:tRNA guanosine(34) transglycosylase Tgt [Candidatus Uhrbacteria bacterium]|nr:tRNA guanosine(34) transglycosylase Tgt [Candidatus Uhrbacteria bacterium]